LDAPAVFAGLCLIPGVRARLEHLIAPAAFDLGPRMAAPVATDFADAAEHASKP
jgi:hypothetical protein